MNSVVSGCYIPHEGKLTPRRELIEAWFWKNPNKQIGPKNIRQEIHPWCTWTSVMRVMRSLTHCGWTFERISNDMHQWYYTGTPPAKKDWAKIQLSAK